MNMQKMIKKMIAKKTVRLSLCGLALAVLSTSQAYAICNTPLPMSLSFPPLVFEGGADGPTIGQPISSSWGATIINPNLFIADANCLIKEGITLPLPEVTRPTGQSYTEEGITYPIYNTSIPGIGLIMGIKATTGASYVPVRYPLTFFDPNPNPSRGMGVAIHAKLIVIGRLSSGVYTLARQDLLRVYANVLAGGGTDDSILTLNATTVTIKASTCQLTSAATQNVPLPPVTKNHFSGVGSSTSAGYNFSLTTLCGSGVKLYATMTDGSDPSNTGTTLKPAEGTTATGVGVQIQRDNGLAIAFGPDSSASGNTNQWYIGSVGSGGSESVTIPLRAHYVQTASDMKAGSVKARATVTFSYQ